MKIVLLHGDDQVASYKRFSKIIDGVVKKGWKVEQLSYKDDIKNKLVNTSLFDENILYAVKNAEKVDIKQLKWLGENEKKFSSQLLLYSSKIINATFKKNLPKSAKIEAFEKPKILWEFLDNLYPSNAKRALNLFHQLSKTEATELVIALISTLFRDIYMCQNNIKLKYPDWKLRKLVSQSQKFTKQEVKSIINQLAELDVQSKTSDLDTILLLEVFLVKNLE